MNFDREYVLNVTKDLLMTDSPTGFCAAALKKAEKYAEELGLKMERNEKGNGIIRVKGGDSSKTVGICAHLDTLGLMVRSVKDCGTLAITNIGGALLPTLDGEYCKVYTRSGKVYTGTILSTSPAVHVFEDAKDKKRDLKNLEIRLDEVVKNKEDVKKLGIENGDFICYDPKTEITESGFIKSRFLDDKLSVGLCFGVLKYFKDNNIKPKHDFCFILSTYEEAGHGSAHIPEEITELLAVDMGCIGEDLSGTEYDVSICPKDSSGPYDYEMTGRLIDMAKENGIGYCVDIFPMYGSDVSAALRAGCDIKGALVGPGVHASHGMERSHYDAVLNTMKLVALYLM
jgi:putative aminopeptidase FrvX